MNAVTNILTALQPETSLFLLLIASWFNSALLGKVFLAALSKKNGKAVAFGLTHIAITALIIWAAFGIGFLA